MSQTTKLIERVADAFNIDAQLFTDNLNKQNYVRLDFSIDICDDDMNITGRQTFGVEGQAHDDVPEGVKNFMLGVAGQWIDGFDRDPKKPGATYEEALRNQLIFHTAVMVAMDDGTDQQHSAVAKTLAMLSSIVCAGLDGTGARPCYFNVNLSGDEQNNMFPAGGDNYTVVYDDGSVKTFECAPQEDWIGAKWSQQQAENVVNFPGNTTVH